MLSHDITNLSPNLDRADYMYCFLDNSCNSITNDHLGKVPIRDSV